MSVARSKNTTARRSLINLRVTPHDRRLIDRAATAVGKNRSEFMLEAARRAAEETLLDKVLFRVDARTYAALITQLDKPPRANAALRKSSCRPRLHGS